MVFDFDSSSPYKEERLRIWVYAVERAPQLIFNHIAKFLNQTSTTKSVFSAIKKAKYLSETTKSNAGVGFHVPCKHFGDKLHIVHTGCRL